MSVIIKFGISWSEVVNYYWNFFVWKVMKVFCFYLMMEIVVESSSITEIPSVLSFFHSMVPCCFLYARLETGRIMWLGMAGVHSGFCTITLVLYIGSLPNLATWFPCGRGRTLFILGSLGQRSRSLTINIIFDNRVISAR